MRFAQEHAPTAPKRTTWLLAALFFFLLAGPVAVFNLAIDPFDFRITPHAPLFREQIQRRNDAVLWSAGELRRVPKSALDEVTVVACGDSRTEMLTGGRSFPRVFKLGSDVILSLSVGGASFEENIALLEAIEPQLPRLRAVILAIPLERIGSVEGNRVPNALKLMNSPLLYVLSLGDLASSIEVLAEQTEVRVQGIADRHRPDVDSTHFLDVSNDWMNSTKQTAKIKPPTNLALSKSEQKTADKWITKIMHPDGNLVDTRLQKIITPLVTRLHRRQVKTVFFLPPLHPVVLSGLDPDAQNRAKLYAASLSKLGQLEDFSHGNTSNISVRFTDASHPTPETARAILVDIYRRDIATLKAP